MPDPFVLGACLASAAALAGAGLMIAVRVRQAWAARRYDEACLLAGAGFMLSGLVWMAGALPFIPPGGTGP